MLSVFTKLLNELSHQASPPRLMTGTNACSIIAVEVFIEQNEIAPVGIGLKRFTAAINGTIARWISQKDAGETLR